MSYTPITPVEVYSGTPTVDTWHDLSLASAIGAKQVMVLIAVETYNQGFQKVALRRKGDTNDPYVLGGKQSGGSQCHIYYWNETGTERRFYWVTTDTSGEIQWIIRHGYATKIVVYGYLDVTMSETQILTGTSSTSFQTLDLSSIVGTQKCLVQVRVRYTGGGNPTIDYVFRPGGETRQVYPPGDLGAYHCAIEGGAPADTANTVVMLTNDVGVVEWANGSNGHAIAFDVICYTPDVVSGSPIQVFSGTTPTGDTVLDLSSHLDGELDRRLVNLLVETSNQYTAAEGWVWPKDDPAPWDVIRPSGGDYGAVNTFKIEEFPADSNTNISEVQVQTDDEGKLHWRTRVASYGFKIWFLGTSPTPFGISSVVSSYLNLRIYFSKGVKNDTELNNPDNYQITVTDPTTAFDFGTVSVIPEENVTYPTYIDLEMTDCTHGKGYTLVITPDKITSEGDDLITSGINTKVFTGVSDLPEVLHVIPLSLTRVKVVFTKYMVQSADFMNIAEYVWTGGIRTLKVEQDTNSSVILTVTTMEASTIYELTVG